MHIVHVGNMRNKGTQSLLMSDIIVIREILKDDVTFSVATTDIEGISRLKLPLKALTQPMVDIPYEKADAYARKSGCARHSIRYKAFALACLFYMFVQIALSVISATLVKAKLKAFYRPKSLGHIKNCDLVVSCSDENFKEGSRMLPFNIYWILTWWSMLISRTCEVFVAKFFRKPIVMFPNSVGPFQTIIGSSLSKIALNLHDIVALRDPISYETVKSLKIRPPKILTSDTALLFKEQGISLSDDPFNRTVGVMPGVYSHALSEKDIRKYITVHAKALDEAAGKHGFSLVFLPHHISGFKYDDLEISKLILGKVKNAYQIKIVEVKNAEEFRSLIGQMSFVISSKLHPAVLAASVYVPALCIAYDPKQTGFFMSLGMTECVVPISEVSNETLSSKIDYIWNNRERLSALLEKRVPELQEHIKKSMILAIKSFIKANSLFLERDIHLRTSTLEDGKD